MFDVMLEGFTDTGGDADIQQMIESTGNAAHRCAACKKVGGKDALSRSCGGFPTEVHLRVNANGMPVAVAVAN